MKDHCNYVRKHLCKDQPNDSIAKYFEIFYTKFNQPRYPTLFELRKFKILYSCNILNLMKDFGTEKFQSYMKERLKIMKKTQRKSKPFNFFVKRPMEYVDIIEEPLCYKNK